MRPLVAKTVLAFSMTMSVILGLEIAVNYFHDRSKVFFSLKNNKAYLNKVRNTLHNSNSFIGNINISFSKIFINIFITKILALMVNRAISWHESHGRQSNNDI